VTVHLAHDHPGANDPAYRARRSEIAAAALAWRPGEPAPTIRQFIWQWRALDVVKRFIFSRQSP
jgi:hypothetical protein